IYDRLIHQRPGPGNISISVGDCEPVMVYVFSRIFDTDENIVTKQVRYQYKRTVVIIRLIEFTIDADTGGGQGFQIFDLIKAYGLWICFLQKALAASGKRKA